MVNEIIRERVSIDIKKAKESTQVLLEGDIIVPDIKPDMAVILQTDSKVKINNAEPNTDRVNFSGKLEIQVLYLAHGDERPVYSMSTLANIDDFINIDGVTREMWVDVKYVISNIEYKMINDRKINYRAIVDINISVWDSNSNEIITDIKDIPISQQLKTMLNINHLVENKSDKIMVKEQLQIPSGKPNIREILQCSINVSNKDIRVNNGRVSVNGEIAVLVLYKGDSENSLIEFTEYDFPFSGNIEVFNATEDMMAEAILVIHDEYIQVTQDVDGEDRVIDLEITIEANLKIKSQENIEILEDVYSTTNNLNLTKEDIKYPKLVCHNKNQVSIKEIVTLTDSAPDLLQIFRANGKTIVDDVKVNEDKVIAEGIIEVDVLYVAESDKAPLFAFNTIIPFRQVIETKGADEDMDVDIEVAIDHIGFNMLSSREMELKYLLSFNVNVMEEIKTSLITDIDFNEFETGFLDSMPSITVYTVSQGDTLWLIAKKYNTSVDELIEINEIEQPAKIMPGNKLLILKKVCTQ